MSKGRKIVFGAVAVVLGTLVGALLVEGALRVFYKPSRFYNSVIAPRTEVTVEHSPDKGLYEATAKGRRLRPNTHGIIRDHYLSHIDVDIRTNEFGFRGGEVEWNKHPRMLFLGDSITLGDYLPEEKTFAALVKEKSGTWEVLNSGVGSIGIDDELAIYVDNADRLKPDVVVLNLYLNDVVPSPVVTLVHPPKLFSSLWTVQYLYQALSLAKYATSKDKRGAIPDALWEGWRLDTANQYPGKDGDFFAKVQENFRDWGSAWHPAVMSYLHSRVKLVALQCKKHKAKFYVVIHPVSFQVEAEIVADQPQRALVKTLRTDGYPVLDLLPIFRAEYKKRGLPRLFYDQCHHTPEGAVIAADAIYEFLK